MSGLAWAGVIFGGIVAVVLAAVLGAAALIVLAVVAPFALLIGGIYLGGPGGGLMIVIGAIWGILLVLNMLNEAGLIGGNYEHTGYTS